MLKNKSLIMLFSFIIGLQLSSSNFSFGMSRPAVDIPNAKNCTPGKAEHNCIDFHPGQGCQSALSVLNSPKVNTKWALLACDNSNSWWLHFGQDNEPFSQLIRQLTQIARDVTTELQAPVSNVELQRQAANQAVEAARSAAFRTAQAVRNTAQASRNQVLTPTPVSTAGQSQTQFDAPALVSTAQLSTPVSVPTAQR